MPAYLSKAADYARAAREMGPRLFLAKALRKVGVRSPYLKRIEVLGDRRQAEPGRLAKIYGDYERRAIRDFDWSPIDFEGARVLEIGCGSLGGLAPLALVEGAASYAGIDPDFDMAVFNHRKMVDGFLPQTLAATAELRDEPDAPSVDDMKARCVFLKTPLEKLEGQEPADVVVSISCLEHIWHFDEALAALKRLTHEKTRHFHVINFGNHRNRARPFDGLYDMPPDDYTKAYGRMINLLRPPDIEWAFAEAGLHVHLHPFDVVPRAVPESPEAWWAETYDRDVLAVRTALVISE